MSEEQQNLTSHDYLVPSPRREADSSEAWRTRIGTLYSMFLIPLSWVFLTITYLSTGSTILGIREFQWSPIGMVLLGGGGGWRWYSYFRRRVAAVLSQADLNAAKGTGFGKNKGDYKVDRVGTVRLRRVCELKKKFWPRLFPQSSPLFCGVEASP